MLRKMLTPYITPAIEKVAQGLVARKITPNMLTFGGLLVTVVAALCYAAGLFKTGAIVLLIGGLGDMFDGAVARAARCVSAFGAFTDSVVDRYTDLIIYSGLIIFYLRTHHYVFFALVLVALYGSLLISYIRARAELVIEKCDVGIMERPERIILIACGSLFNFMPLALWLLAILTQITAIQRIYYTYQQAVTKHQ